MRCHAGAAHDAACDHGAWGWLCDACWVRVVRLMARIGVKL